MADNTAIGLLLAERHKAARVRTLQRLQTSIARTNLTAPVLDTTNFAIAAQSATSSFGAGTFTDYLVTNGNAGRFTFGGAVWALGTGYPNDRVFRPTTLHAGNGTDINANSTGMPGMSVRFFSEAPKLELYFQSGNAQGGFRIKVDGKYVRTGHYGNSEDNNLRYGLITWGDGTVTYRKKRLYELEFATGKGFGGVRCEKIYSVRQAPQADGIRLMTHGDSRHVTVVDSALNIENQLNGWAATHFANLMGQSDYWSSNVGGTGWLANNSGTCSKFNERVGIDVVAVAPDVIVETGGCNDQSSITAYGQSNYQALVETWLQTVISAKPETLIFMTGPILVRGVENSGSTNMAVRDAKKAAALLYPKNVVFIDNLAEAWISGSGRQGATAGDGESDWVTGTDSAHYTCPGHIWAGERLAHAVAGAIPRLIAANA